MLKKNTIKQNVSIYEFIKMNTKDGHLPERFRIPWLKDMWAPGAHDGTLLKHMHPLDVSTEFERKNMILDALKLMSDKDNGNNVEEVIAIFEELDNKFGIVRLYGEICASIVVNRQALNLRNLLSFADWLLCNGLSLLTVKLGLTILSIYDAPFVETVMMEMGVYDEFTYYSARTLSKGSWPKGNEELFILAKNVHGWGRIHAVEWIKPETQEIKDWLLFEGADNTVIPQYSANICLQKAEAENRLEGDLSTREYKCKW